MAPPAISPDGRQICFSYRKQGTAGLYVIRRRDQILFDRLRDNSDVVLMNLSR